MSDDVCMPLILFYKYADRSVAILDGVFLSRGISHSVLSDMQTISQDSPKSTQSSSSSFDRFGSRSRRDIDDDFEIIGGFSSGPPKFVVFKI